MITLFVLCVLNTLLTFFVLYRTGRIILEQNEQSDAFIQALNFQTRKIKELTMDVHSAMDCMLTADFKAAASTDTN